MSLTKDYRPYESPAEGHPTQPWPCTMAGFSLVFSLARTTIEVEEEVIPDPPPPPPKKGEQPPPPEYRRVHRDVTSVLVYDMAESVRGSRGAVTQNTLQRNASRFIRPSNSTLGSTSAGIMLRPGASSIMQSTHVQEVDDGLKKNMPYQLGHRELQALSRAVATAKSTVGPRWAHRWAKTVTEIGARLLEEGGLPPVLSVVKQ